MKVGNIVSLADFFDEHRSLLSVKKSLLPIVITALTYFGS